MGMKFLNKKGWHTGSLRNIENVWKAEQKHEQEQKKLEELRKQILEERERAEFRQLQEQAGLVPRQERLDFLYDSGLAVGKSSEGFKSLEAYPKAEESSAAGPSSSAAEQISTPGALFEVKPQSANDAWRKLHSDPLLMIRQREQEALARIRNNPVKMAMIRRSVEESKNKDNSGDKKAKKKKHGDKKPSHKKHSSRSRHSDDDDDGNEDTRKGTTLKKEIARSGSYASKKPGSDSEDEVTQRSIQRESGRERESHKAPRHYRNGSGGSDSEEFREKRSRRMNDREIREKHIYDKKSRNYREARHGSDSEEETRGRGGQRKFGRESRGNDVDDKGLRRYRDVRPASDSEEEDGERGSQRKDDIQSRGTDYVLRGSKQYIDVRRDSDVSRERGRQKDSENRHDHLNDRARNTEIYSGTGRKSEKSMHSSHSRSDNTRQETKPMTSAVPNMIDVSARGPDPNPPNRRKKAPKLSEEERAARLREMQLDAEVHEEQRWKRLKKADEDDAREAALAAVGKGKNFLEVAKKNVYGAEQGGSATIEESVRRRSHYLQGKSAADAGNAFRR